MSLGWPPLPTGILLFFGLLPLFVLENEAKKWVVLKIYASLLLWNIGTTWWVWNASPEGCIAMLLANSGLMLLPFIFYRRVKRFFGLVSGLAAWIITWLSMEYLHLNWEIAYPWLNLGNGMACLPWAIQWYEFTGSLGGSLWILLVNALLFYYLRHQNRNNLWKVAVTLALPILISLLMLKSSPEGKSELTEIVIVQPNVDPYQKFDQTNPVAEVEAFIKLAEPKISEKTEFVLFPETGFTENVEEAEIDSKITYKLLKIWLEKHPNLTLVTGGNTYRFFDRDKKTATARKFSEDKYYDVYNAAIALDSSGVKAIYRKSKLVPGVEKMPYTQIFSFLENYSIALGGISGSLGIDSSSCVMFSKNKLGGAPLICYESIFGEYVSSFVKKGANFIFVITNDGWWGNTPGYRQHRDYAVLRAIENRRAVIRCANTGISCRIDTKGNVIDETAWWQPEVKTYQIESGQNHTFYTLHGDFIALFAAYLFPFVFLLSIFAKPISRKIFN